MFTDYPICLRQTVMTPLTHRFWLCHSDARQVFDLPRRPLSFQRSTTAPIKGCPLRIAKIASLTPFGFS